ncbi:MAG: lysostaphin resistance A-like protein [Halobacteriales archaeon]
MSGAVGVGPVVVGAFVVVLPVCYQLNARITPWAGGRLAEGGDRYLGFWTSNTVLHWSSTLAVVGVVLLSGTDLSAVGLAPPHRAVTAPSVAAFVGSLAVYYRDVLARPAIDADRARRRGDFWTPVTDRERRLGVFVLGVTPGVCEEVVYRGFLVTALRSLGASKWTAVGVATVPFVLLHGRAATASLRSFARYALLGVVFAGLYLRYGTVWPGVALHAAYNLAQTARGSRQYFEPSPR